MQSDDIRPPAAFDRTPADDALDLALAVTTAGLPAVVPTVTVDQDPARAAWSDQMTQSNDLMNLCVFVKVALPYLQIPCGCAKDFECIRCQALRIALKYLPDPAPVPQQEDLDESMAPPPASF